MIKLLFPLVLMGCFAQPIYSQQKTIATGAVAIPEASCVSVDALSAYIKENFVTDSARIRAIYTWVANNISYDVALLPANQKNPQSKPRSVADVLKMRSGVCQGYAELFTALCRNVGINAVKVGGYGKSAGKVVQIAHAWAGAKLDGEWFLFDPTWDAGYVNDDHFVKRLNMAFYKQSPKDFIADHMPFDPIFQFLSYPITNREFIDGSLSNNKILFNYNDSLDQYRQLSATDLLNAELRRLELAGIENDLLKERKQYLVKSLQLNSSQNGVQESGKTFSKAIALMNEYIANKNKQFSTTSDYELLQSLDSMKHYIKLSRSLISQAVVQNDEQQRVKSFNLANIDQYWKQLNQEEMFIQKYLATDKAARRELFNRK